MSPVAESMAALPPVARKVPRELAEHGDVRVDNYYWLSEDARADPAVLAHLRAENDYAAALMSDAKQLEDKIFAEIKGKIKEDDIDAPLRKGKYYYYKRTLTGKVYVQHCRRLVPTDDPITVHDVMPTGPDAPAEHIILDENVKAEGHDYYRIGAFKVSPSGKLVAYAEDTEGDEIYTVFVMDVESGQYVGQPLKGITSDIEWAGDDNLVYITMDDILRPDKVWLHKLGSDQLDDTCLYHEKDDTFSLVLQASESKQYLFVECGSKSTVYILYLDIPNQSKELVILTPRVDGIETTASHRGNHFYIKWRSDELYNSELVACPLDNVAETTVLLPRRESVNILDFQLFENHIAVYERENGLPKATVYRLPATGEAVGQLQGGRAIDFADPAYALEPEPSQFHSNVICFYYSSMRTPPSIFDYDMDTGVSVLKKIDTVLGGFDASNYVTERKWAAASDGTQIPMTILYRKDMVKLDGSDPMLLYGHGSYGICIDSSFRGSRFSLVDRGFIYVIAHIHGGGEMGRQWHEDGKLLKKTNTFTDFIACAEHLIENKYCSKEKLCINGRSAGGLLMGAVLNMRPYLFKAAVAEVPSVDVLTTMLDPTIPWTTAEWEEWGDPRKEEYYYYMKSYSPVDNVKAQGYPHILVTAGLNDPHVMYSEPAKFVAKLRELKTDDNLLLFKCEVGGGHFSKTGRLEKLEKLQEDAFTYAFILKALGMTPPTKAKGKALGMTPPTKATGKALGMTPPTKATGKALGMTPPTKAKGKALGMTPPTKAKGVERPQRSNLRDAQRFAAYSALKALSKDRKIKTADKEHVADVLKTSVRTVERIWKQANDQLARGEKVDVSIKKKGRCGRKRTDIGLSRISSIPLEKRSTLKALAMSLDVPCSTLHNRMKLEKIEAPHKQREAKIAQGRKRKRGKSNCEASNAAESGPSARRTRSEHRKCESVS